MSSSSALDALEKKDVVIYLWQYCQLMRRYTTLGKSIWVIITRGYGNHKCNIEFITSGRRPQVINSILHE